MDNLCASPFVVKNRWNFWNYLKITLMAVFVFPIRIILITALFFFFWLSSVIMYDIKTYVHRSTVGWKRFYIWLPAKILRLITIVFGFYVIRQEDRTNKDDPTKPSILLLLPHSTIFDLMVIPQLDTPTFVAGESVSHHPLVGYLIALAEPILVRRDDPASRAHTKELIKERAANGEQILIVPEGTNTNREMIIRFKPGAFYPGLPVQAVYMKYETDDNIDSLSWTWDGLTMPTVVFLTLCKFYTSLKMIHYTVYKPNPEEQNNANVYRDNVHKTVCEWSKTRSSLFSFDDTGYFLFAKIALVPRSPVGSKFIKLVAKILICYITDATVASNSNRDNNLFQLANWYMRQEQIENRQPSVDRFRDKLKELDNRKGIAEKQVLYYALIHIINKAKANIQLNNATEIETQADLTRILGFDSETDLVAKMNNTTEDFFFAFSVEYGVRVSTTNLFVVLTLLDPRIEIWERIKMSFNTLESTSGRAFLDVPMFKLLIWYLLGLEKEVIEEQLFNTERITYQFAQERLYELFRRAVKENAPFVRKSPAAPFAFDCRPLETIVAHHQ